MVHLKRFEDKFNFVLYCLQKLFALVQNLIEPDKLDAVSNHEVLLPGQVYGTVFKEKCRGWLASIAANMTKKLYGIARSNRRRSRSVGGGPREVITAADLASDAFFKKCMEQGVQIDQRLSYFLATGNIVADSSLDFMQKTGFCIVAEKLNHLRYISHYKAIHRGQFFTTMKTTKVRKLLPESWGFLCPVHTPDGSPCGLLNHLTASCVIVTERERVDTLKDVLCSLGMVAVDPGIVFSDAYIPVILDGRVLGAVPSHLAHRLAQQLRVLKVQRKKGVPSSLEIAFVDGKWSKQFPSLLLHTSPCRMMRPVHNLSVDHREYIGSLEQIYLNIACLKGEIDVHKHSHAEIKPTNVLSIIANMTPFSDFNQSPRNMYQCQMGKQTMAVSCHSIKERVDNKMYHLVTPQNPIVVTDTQEEFKMNEYPMGTNAIVAVISYTGYDMEDAMIINKSSAERGFKHGYIYKTKIIDLTQKGQNKQMMSEFGNPANEADGELRFPELDADGLPPVGYRLEEGKVFYSTLEGINKTPKGHPWRSNENAVIDTVRILGPSSSNRSPIQTVLITLRVCRNPVIGDKFSSRHGQKGVLSKLWPQEDMPFSERGMTPDIIINPHAFPSRMTIGMLIESMAGKAGALHGIKQDATPFKFDENQTAVDFFGEQLVKAGFSYYGTEPLYSGITGVPMDFEIFLGMVFYQRLRHMVGDKFQVRSTGPVNEITHQPVKGRKFGGGIRLGEMERDSLLAHGVSFMLHDRLMNCSDSHRAHVCSQCGGILSISYLVPEARAPIPICLMCNSREHVCTVMLPFVFRYLVNELAAMNIRIRVVLKDVLN